MLHSQVEPPRIAFLYPYQPCTSSLCNSRFLAEISGTHFWHTHTGQQRGDGGAGMFVVRQPPSEDVHSSLYDYDLPEHQIIIQDWLLVSTNDFFLKHHFSDGDNKVRTIAINGKGSYRGWTKENSNQTFFTPLEDFRVSPGHRYRFRLVSNVLMNSPFVLSIDGHQLLVIASDGRPFEPVVMDSLVIYGGERFDFILDASANVSNYWMRVTGLLDGMVYNSSQLAILRYEGSAEEPPTAPSDYESMHRSGKVCCFLLFLYALLSNPIPTERKTYLMRSSGNCC